MIKIEKEYDSLYNYLTNEGNDLYDSRRDSIKLLMERINYQLVYDESGDYDSGKNGFVIYKSPDGQLWRINFQEDSYSDGYISTCSKVTAKTKTITVWE